MLMLEFIKLASDKGYTVHAGAFNGVLLRNKQTMQGDIYPNVFDALDAITGAKHLNNQAKQA